jgi:anaphase-promoting complex subunit 5
VTVQEQPLSASFVKIAEAAGVFNYWCDRKMGTVKESDQWALHAVQANVWTAVGCEELGDLAADVVAAFTLAGSADNNRLTVLLNSAYRRARQGNYDNALAILLDPVVWNRLALPDYKLWAQEVWQVLALRATRRGQDRLYREFLLPRQPPGERNPQDYVYIPWPHYSRKISDSLSEVLRMRVYYSELFRLTSH